MAWLEPHPNGGRNDYLCKVYVDRPEVWPSGLQEVVPYTQPILDAAMRQGVALQTPGAIYYGSYYEDRFMPYNYVFKYHSPIGDRVAQMMCFNLSVIRPE